MNKQELKCCWCWWARINENNRLICSNHTPDCYNKDVTEKDACFFFININTL